MASGHRHADLQVRPCAGTTRAEPKGPRVAQRGWVVTAVPSWVEQMAWRLECPTCQAPAGRACASLRKPDAILDFNHPARNWRFHQQRQHERSVERSFESDRAHAPDTLAED